MRFLVFMETSLVFKRLENKANRLNCVSSTDHTRVYYIIDLTLITMKCNPNLIKEYILIDPI